jgi:CubicO group peptidase (beta-lactamase class C family)
MHRQRFSVPAVFVLLVLVVLVHAVAAGVAAQAPAEFAAKAHELLAAHEEVRGWAGAALVMRGDEVLLSTGVGAAHRELGVANTPETVFRIGSVTKQFTAAAILLLAERGKLAVTDPVCKYVSDCPEAWQPITIHHLLTHTAGLPNFTSFPDYLPTMAQPSPPEKTLERFRGRPLNFAPGERFEYSNSGYVLLGYILEKAAGEPYAKFLRENLLAPAGLVATDYDDTATLVPHRAAGYARSDEGFVNAPYMDMTIPHAAGALYSTVGDLCRWTRAVHDGQLLSEESRAALFRPAHNNYAYGWFVAPRFDRTEHAHGGGINGFSAGLSYYPEEEVCIAVLSNVQQAVAGPVARDLAALLFEKPYTLPRDRRAISVDPAVLAGYIGRFQVSPGFVLEITLEDGRLMSQAPGQPKVELFAESETEFFLRVVDAQVVFEPGPDGRAARLVLHQAGRQMPAPRIE